MSTRAPILSFMLLLAAPQLGCDSGASAPAEDTGGAARAAPGADPRAGGDSAGTAGMDVGEPSGGAGAPTRDGPAGTGQAGAPAADAAMDASEAGAGGAGDTAQAPAGEWPDAAALVGGLRLGWNLGNSLDVPDSETAWGNPPVNQALLDGVKAAGFDTVRIPVTWALRMGPGPDYAIDPAFLDRVGEVVGYVHAAGMTAIVNLHHDGADAWTPTGPTSPEWITLNDPDGNVTDQNNAAVETRFVAVWQQIATHFEGHGSDLLFESMNEIHDGYGPPMDVYLTIVNELNQAFVDTVRATGGNNLERCLVVPGYNTNIEHTIAGFVLPTDPTPNRLILSVHFYDPWTFTINAEKSWGAGYPDIDDWGQESHVVEQFDSLLREYVSQGLPVLVGEYGASRNPAYEANRRYYMEYVTKVMVDRGILPIYWDNGGTLDMGDNFGLFSRTDGAVAAPEIVAAMVKAATQDYDLSAVPKP